ncbi:DsbA family protein [Patescibacteria group bacterium]|nr:DsbA family protein [Patescibacteria group bacterium]
MLPTVKKKSWYRKWWGIALIGLIVMLIAILMVFVFQFGKIFNQIKHGDYLAVNAATENPPYEMEKFIDPLSPSIGAKDAKIVIVEFGDFNCSQCLKAFPIVREIAEKYKDKILLYWRNYPVVAENSIDFARASVCAQQQNKFWALHDKFFQLQGKIEPENFSEIAVKTGINKTQFEKCLQNNLTEAQIRKDFYAGEDGEVRGTPTFFINGYKIEGPIPFEIWEQIIGNLLTIYGENTGN